jgi:hypothetical protein
MSDTQQNGGFVIGGQEDGAVCSPVETMRLEVLTRHRAGLTLLHYKHSDAQ